MKFFLQNFSYFRINIFTELYQDREYQNRVID